MKHAFFLLSFVVFFSSCKESVKQVDHIHYGSNKGRYLSIRSKKIYFEEYGKGVPLLLLHPGLGSIENFMELIPKLSDSFRVIIPDAPGHGRSEDTDSVSRQLLAEFSSELIDKLQLDSVYILGWSTGGISSLILAANRPDKVKKVISGGSNATLNGITPEGLS